MEHRSHKWRHGHSNVAARPHYVAAVAGFAAAVAGFAAAAPTTLDKRDYSELNSKIPSAYPY